MIVIIPYPPDNASLTTNGPIAIRIISSATVACFSCSGVKGFLNIGLILDHRVE